MEYARGLVIGTFMPLTKGHEKLLEFAANYLTNDNYPYSDLNIIISTRSHEPFVQERIDSLYEWRPPKPSDSVECYVFNHDDDAAPQNPNESRTEEDFWNYWVKTINELLDENGHKAIDGNDILFASEAYGVRLAQELGCQFVPFNQSREIVDVSATQIRKDPIKNFHLISRNFQDVLQKTVTFFGPESCGKTTLSKRLSQKMNAHFIPEYARDYLEMVGEDLSSVKMHNIYLGQLAIQNMASYNAHDKPFIFQDTDLLTTIGYYELWQKYIIPSNIYSDFEQTKSDLYIIMNDQIPFEADPLRYGDGKRETGTNYWVDLLERYDCNYHIMKGFTKKEQFFEAQDVINAYFIDKAKPLMDFVRT